MEEVADDLHSQLDSTFPVGIVEEVITNPPSVVDVIEDAFDKVKTSDVVLSLGIVEDILMDVDPIDAVIDKIRAAEVAPLPAKCGFMEPLRTFLQSARRFLSKPKGPLTSI